MKCKDCPCQPDRKCIFEGNKRVCSIIKDRPDYYKLAKRQCEHGDVMKKTQSSLLNRAVNFAGSVVQHAIGGFREVPLVVLEERRTICQECPLRSDRTCSVCGCLIEIKTRWASEKCPDDPPRWLEYTEEKKPPGGGGCACGGSKPPTG